MDDTETKTGFQAGAFVLVGGQSRRMGRSKALLESNCKPLALYAVELVFPLVAEVTLLGPPDMYSNLGYHIIPDRYPVRGPFAALCTGLRYSRYDWNLFLACDLPLMERGVIKTLLALAMNSHAEAIVPMIGGYWQPLCAVYHRSCLATMEAALCENKSSIAGVLPLLQLEAVSAEQLGGNQFTERAFRNVNTPQDWLETQQLIGADNR